jgi:hypothetical protein
VSVTQRVRASAGWTRPYASIRMMNVWRESGRASRRGMSTPAGCVAGKPAAFPPYALRAISPPSTGITAPVMYEAPGRQRLKVTCATSSGRP